MPQSPLQTLDKRKPRFTFRRRARRNRRLAALVALATLAVAILAAWGYWSSASNRPARSAKAQHAAEAPRKASAQGTKPTKAKATFVKRQAAPSRPATLTIAAVGDMIFDRGVADLISAEGGQAPLSEVAGDLSKADLAIGNLESTLSDGGTQDADKDVTFRGDPRAIEGLETAGFDLLSLANNHVLDYGPDALADSIKTLDAAGIGHAGAGADQKTAWTPATVERDGAKVAFFSFSHIVPAGFIAQPDRAGMASGKMDMTRTDRAIREAKKTHDYVIVSFHWGVEYEDDANDAQVENAHRAIDNGADIVLAHHPHVIQGIELYKGKLIAYSLGDFVFDHYSRKTGEAFVLHAELGPDGTTGVRAVPVYLDGSGKPEYVQGSEAQTILQRLSDISEARDTSIQLVDDEARLVQ